MKTRLLVIILLIIPAVVGTPPHAHARCITDKSGHLVGHCSMPQNPEIFDTMGHRINGSATTGHQIQIAAYMTNDRDTNETFAYLGFIRDVNGITLSLSWITGILTPYQSLHPAQLWAPMHSGTYTAEIFFWSSLTNPNYIQPPASTPIYVCDAGLVAVMTIPGNSLDCVRPDAAQKLVEQRHGEYYHR